ncbi:MAG: hypothetical protein K6A75_07400 [Ruminococcus sp.]|nr:hypothetical protein [Ruminococcus sp.]
MVEKLTIFFGGAFLGAVVTFASMCFAYCAGRGGEEEKENGDDEDME